MDTSTGETITRDPDHLDESYKDRLRRTGAAVSVMPPEPPNMRSRVERTGDGFIINIPLNTKRGLHYIPVLASLIFAGIVLLFFMRIIHYIPLAFIVLFVIAGPAFSALLRVHRLNNESEKITITKSYLRMEALKEGKSKTTEIPVSELEDFMTPAR